MRQFALMKYFVASLGIEGKIILRVREENHLAATPFADIVLLKCQELGADALSLEVRLDLKHTEIPYAPICFLIVVAWFTCPFVHGEIAVHVLPVGGQINLPAIVDKTLP